MGRANWVDGVEIVLEDLNRTAKGIERILYDRVIFELIQKTENAFFDSGFDVIFSNASTVNVSAGVGFQTDGTQTSPEPQKRLLYLGSNTSASFASPDGSQDRIDLVCVRAAIVDEITSSRKFKDAISDTITDQSLVVQRDWEAEILVVEGTPDASPSAPATPAGYIKIAEVLVSAVTGIANQAAITDTRSLMPVGGNIVLDTLGFERLTASASTPLSTLISDIEGFLVAGLQDYVDIVENNSPDAEVGTPATDRQRLFYRDGTLFLKDDTGAKTPVGSGGGGGAGARWLGSAVESEEYSQEVKKFSQGASQTETLYVKVPSGYVPGRQISCFLGAYSPSSSNEWRFQIVSTLIRQDQDALTSTANQETNNSGDIVNDQADEFKTFSINLSSSSGAINGFSVSAGDLIKLELTRIAPNDGTEDTADIRFIPSTTEVKFG
jgi:hypothetical protein